jgi:hypothetical protein
LVVSILEEKADPSSDLLEIALFDPGLKNLYISGLGRQ